MTSAKKNKNPLEGLRPIADKNAIQEVVFTLHLDDSTPLKSPQSFDGMHKGKFKESFSKFDTITLQSWRFNGEAAEQASAEIVGFTFEQYNPDGTLQHRLRGEKSRPNEPRPSWVAVNILKYDRWAGESKKAYAWLKETLEIQDDLLIKGISLHYIDALFWESSLKLPFNKIFQKGSTYLPQKISQKAEKWSSKMAYEEDKGDHAVVSELSVSVAPHPKTGHKKIRIENPLTLLYETPVSMKDELEGKIKEDFQMLHDENKNVMKSILNAEVCKTIGLK